MITTALKTATIALVIVAGTAGAAFAKTAWADGKTKVFDGPTKFYSVIDKLHDGEKVDVEFCKENKFDVVWCYVEKKGPDGWVKKSDLHFKKAKKYDDDYDVEVCIGGGGWGGGGFGYGEFCFKD